jgi:hypothetical protein
MMDYIHYVNHLSKVFTHRREGRAVHPRSLGLLERNCLPVFLTLVGHPGLSKKDLEHLCQLSRPTVDKILRILLSHRFVVPSGYSASTGGRRSALYQINKHYKYVIGVDFEIPHLNLVLCDLSGAVLQRETHKMPLKRSDDPQSLIDFAIRQVREVVEGAGLSLSRVAGLGLGAPGFLQNGALTLWGETLPAWRKVPVKALLEEELGIPVVVGSDAGFMALAESFHLTRPEPVLIYLVLRQGIEGDLRMGGSVLMGRRVFWGAHGNAVSLQRAFVHLTLNQKIAPLLEKQLVPPMADLIALFDPGRVILQARILGPEEPSFLQGCVRRLKRELGETFQDVVFTRAQEGEWACAKGAAFYVLQEIFESDDVMERLRGGWTLRSRAVEVPGSRSALAPSIPKHHPLRGDSAVQT